MTQKTIKLLAVDDIEENLLVLEALLERPNVTLLKARSGREALEMLLVEEVALALVDVQMPEMDGFELAELMRGSPRTRSVPIIFVTAGSRDQSRVFQGYEAGAVDFLYKPLDAHVLRSKVSVFIAMYEQKNKLAEHVEQLEQALRLNETFTAVLGHDLRTPLHAVLLGAETLLRRPSEERALQNAQRIRSSALRMARMIDQLLDLARARSGGGIPVTPAPADLAELCTRASQEIEIAGGGRSVAVHAVGNTAGRWDVDRLLQVITNLMNNAVRHGDPNQPITAHVDGTRPDEVRVAVRNGGVIPTDVLPHIFEPFRSGRRNSGEGLGLGLFIARSMVEAHGGMIGVRSMEPAGTEFEIRLPREAAPLSG
jgi:two-component system, sensor histidine kinase and response regulator